MNNINKISNEILNEIGNNIQQVFKLGQANAMASVLYFINVYGWEVSNIKKYLNDFLNEDQEVKNYTYDCMKDIK